MKSSSKKGGKKIKKKPKRIIKNKLDKIFSLIIREYGSCEKCGKRDGLQCAHIFSRSNLAVRWDTDNAWCLCAGCHLYWAHKNPVEFTEWTRDRMGDIGYQVLREKAQSIKKWTDLELSQLFIKLCQTKLTYKNTDSNSDESYPLQNL